MTKKNETIIFWIIGIVLFLLVAPKLPFLHGNFAVLTSTTCADGVSNYYSLDGNLLDSKGNMDAVNHGAIFVTGKINQGIEFNGTNYISFPAFQNLSVSMWVNNYSNSLGWVHLTVPLSSTFGLGLNGSVDEIIVGTNISQLGNIQPCYQTTSYANVTCNDYVTSQVPDNSTGSLRLTGDYYPNCTWTWQSPQYGISNNLCSKNFLYNDNCISSNNCYSTNQMCFQNLTYNCYTLSNNVCSEKTDYSSCVMGTNYPTLSACNSFVIASPASTTTTTTTATQTSTDLLSSLNKEIFNIFGISITLLYLLIALVIIIGLLYLLSRKK